MSAAPGPTAASAPSRAPSGNALPLGSRVGDFEVTAIIGEGGFGIVYEAFDHTLHRRVALKEYMPSALASRRGDFTVAVRSPQHEQTFRAGLKSFVNEARLLAQFDHPALVKVFRFWESNDTAYMVMPLYEGRTLKDALKEHPHPDEGWMKGLLAPLLDALETLHNAKCYHRDIAPDNILILSNGAPLLLDFGAARRIIGDLTQAVTVILKPGYAPIEQYADDATLKQGPWTDIYALSAVLCLAITGKAPSTSVTRMVSDPMGSLEHSVPGYSPGFLAALDRGLAVRPEQRPQSIAEFRELLGLRTLAPVSVAASARRDAPASLASAPSGESAADDPGALDELARSMIAGQPQSWIRSGGADVPPTEVAPVPVTIVNPDAYRPPLAPPRVATGAPAPKPTAPKAPATPQAAPAAGASPQAAPAAGASPQTGMGNPRTIGPTIAKVPSPEGTRTRPTTIIPPADDDTYKVRAGLMILPSVAMGAVLLAVMGGGVWWFSRTIPVDPVPPVADAGRTAAAPPASQPVAPPAATVPAATVPAATVPAATVPAATSPSTPAQVAVPPPSAASDGSAVTPPTDARTPGASGTTTPGGASGPAGTNASRIVPGTGVSGGPAAGPAAPGAAGTVAGSPGGAVVAGVAVPTAVPRAPRPFDCGFAPPPPPPDAVAAADTPVHPPPPSGRVPLSIRPWGYVFIDGRNCGMSPPKKDLLLPEGKYKLEVRNPTFESHAENIEISARRGAPMVSHTFK